MGKQRSGCRASWSSSAQRPEYTEGNLLRALHVSVRGAPEQTVIMALEYNARGQRTRCAHGNGTTSTYEYDPKNFRLTEVIAARGGLTLQHLLYTFDAIGNVVVLREVESAPVCSGTVPVDGDGLYEYDPLYRLAIATGREHPATQPTEVDTPLGSSGIPHANDLQALQGYTESHTYDKVGNIQRVSHRSGPSGSTGWTRNYSYETTSNRLLATSVPGSELDLSEVYTYDEHGSMTSMPRLAIMEWDYADRLQHTRKTAGGAPQDTAGGVRLSAESIRIAIKDYGGALVVPPDSAFAELDAIRIRDSDPPRWSIRFDLWTEQEGRSDLTLEMTVEHGPQGPKIELDNIHVL